MLQILQKETINKPNKLQRILAIIITHNGYIPLLDKVQKAVRNLSLPFNTILDIKIIVGKKFGNHPDKSNKVSQFSEKNLQKLVNIRNSYLKKARKSEYDWILHIDGDILPPKNGLVKLLETNKKYIGGWAYNKKGVGRYVVPDRIRDEVVYDCETIGNMFLLEHKDIFKVKYRLFNDKKNIGDCLARCRDIRAINESCWVHSGVRCEHLLENGEIYEP